MKRKLNIPNNLIVPVLLSYASIKIAGFICSTIIIIFSPYWWLGGILFMATILIRVWFDVKDPLEKDKKKEQK